MVSKGKKNERLACDAVARVLEQCVGLKRSHERFPEDEKNCDPDRLVDYVFKLGSRIYAFEHTKIEAFNNQIGSDVAFNDLFSYLKHEIDSKIPLAGMLMLTFEHNCPMDIGDKKRLKDFQDKIIAWVLKVAGEIQAEILEPGVPEHPPVRQRPLGEFSWENFKIRLILREYSHVLAVLKNGIDCRRLAPGSLESLRDGPLNGRLENKLPKLSIWKVEGYRSILILECLDLILSNRNSILEALHPALEQRSDPPDEVWLVETATSQLWTVWCLMRDGVSLPDENGPVRFHQFDPASLLEVGL